MADNSGRYRIQMFLQIPDYSILQIPQMLEKLQLRLQIGFMLVHLSEAHSVYLTLSRKAIYKLLVVSTRQFLFLSLTGRGELALEVTFWFLPLIIVPLTTSSLARVVA